MGRETQALKAAIDIGSNTVLLLVGYYENNSVVTLYEDQHAPRLGKGVDAGQNLHPDAMANVVSILNQYWADIEEYYEDVDEVFVTATSAVRDATNRQEFIEKIKQETGFPIQILTGKEEAQFTFFGAQSVLQDKIGGATGVLDIGGGSTEIALGNKNILNDRFSYNVGSVRFTERYLIDNPPTEKQMEKCRSAILEAFKEQVFYFPPKFTLVGVEGTVTSLAHIHLGLDFYDSKKINGQVISLEVISEWISQFKDKTSDELLSAHPKILKGRADVILGGLLILEAFMKSSNIADIVVSTGGIRHGALIMNQK